MTIYEITLTRSGKHTTFRLEAPNCQAAISALCAQENAPVEAVAYWRVVPTAKQIARTKSLRGI